MSQTDCEPDVSTRYKLIVLDLDGTLLDGRKLITDRTRVTLERAQSDGVAVAIATGRSYAMARFFVDGLPLNGPQITYNGAAIVDPVTSRPMYLQALPSNLVSPVIGFLCDERVFTSYFTEDDIYVLQRSSLELALVPADMPPAKEVASFDELLHHPAIKIVATAPRDRIDALRPVGEAAFGADLYVTRTDAVLLEFLHPEVSKGAALRKVMQSLGLDSDQVIAFGDSHNDLDLLQIAGTGVAMGNADNEVKAQADIVAPPNTEDGVARVLEAMLWS
jgi:Cof subfamily protein (haloacid dehalogenase superfamily)